MLPKLPRAPNLAVACLALLSSATAAEPRSGVLVVDWGHDWGTGWYRETPDKQANPPRKLAPSDLNGNGTTEDDFTNGHEFSLDVPLSPTNAVYDHTLPSARFYGGAYISVTDIPRGEDGRFMRPKGMTEGHINQNHELRDDWNLMAMPSRNRDPHAERFEGAILCLWKKEDFLNGASAGPVAFGADDYIGVFVSRYWGGVDWGRWVVQNGSKFLISRPTFAGLETGFDLETTGELNGAENPVVRRTHVVHPDRVEWAEYHPAAPAAIRFEPASASYSRVKFDDVRAVGFLVQRALSQGRPVAKGLWALPHGVGEPVALKFNAVQVRATLPEADRAVSPHLGLSRIGGPGAGTLVGTTEVTFAQWSHVWRWAVTNQRASRFPDGMEKYQIGGYSFAADGSPGSAAMGRGTEHADTEPVTVIGWHDAVAWCNALSELEGLEPAYYEDPGHARPYRTVANRRTLEDYPKRGAVHWKTGASGYRLPTRNEFLILAAGAPAPGTASRTLPAGDASAGANGLHGLLGNVAELVWTAGPGAPDDGGVVTAMGGSFRGSADENAATLRPFSERPWHGTDTVGFRVARGPVLSGAPAGGAVPERRITRDAVVRPEQPMDREALRALVSGALREVAVKDGAMAEDGQNPDQPAKSERNGDLSIAAVETSYAVFRLVRMWAEADAGYSFDFQGDPGSIRHVQEGMDRSPRSPDEPVTNIAWVDAAVWCNALSELAGLRPAYLDAPGGAPIRRANPFRLAMYPEYHYANTGRYAQRPVDTAAIVRWHLDATSGGYRLPVVGELEALRAARPADAQGWLAANSGGRTHPVGTLGPDPRGLHDIEGNVMEWTFGGSSLFGQTRFGNSFSYPAGVLPHKANRNESMFVGREAIGFRVVRTVK